MNKTEPDDSFPIFVNAKVVKYVRSRNQKTGELETVAKEVTREVRNTCPWFGVEVGSERCYRCVHQRRFHMDARYLPWTVACFKKGEAVRRGEEIP